MGEMRTIQKEVREYLHPRDVDMVIYHKSCSDGFCAAFCLYKYRKMKGELRDIVYIPRNYTDSIPDVAGKNVLVLDFSFKKEICIEMMKKANKFLLLDHHKTAMDELNELSCPNGKIYFDMDKSGAMLAWEYCFPGVEAPELVKLVQDRDLWRWELEDSKEFSYIFMDVPFIFEEYEKYLDHNVILETKKNGKIIREYVDRCVKSDARRSVCCTFLGYHVRALNCTRYISEVGNEMVNMMWERESGELGESVDFAVLWRYDQIKHKYVFSLRGNGRVDTSFVSQTFGGGGHPNASGFVLDVLPKDLV